MGKHKQSRRKLHKENPTGLPSVKEFEETEDISNGDREKALESVYGEVQSCNLEEKLSALQTLESMSYDSCMAVHIAKDGIAKIIGPLLIDHNATIRTATASTLRQIADNGGEDAHASLTKDDIMTPLIALFKQYYTDWQLLTDFKDKQARDEKETFIQSVALLWTLCENNESVIKCVNEENIVSILIKFIDINIYGIEIATVTIQCMVSLSEDNDIAIKRIKQHELILYNLLDLKVDNDKNTSEMYSLKTSTAGLLINISNCTDNNQIDILCKILSIFSEVLGVNHKELLHNLTSILPHEKNASSSNNKKKVQENKRMLGTQQQALEILANLCFDEEDGTIDSDMDDCEPMEIESECLDEDAMNNGLNAMSMLPVKLVEVINNCNLIDKIWDKTVTVDKDNRDILDQNADGKVVLKQFHTLQCRAYLCLNNLLSSLEINIFGGIHNLYRKWLEIGTAVFQDANSSDIELLEAATAAMRAILQRLTDIPTNVFKQLTLTDIQLILNSVRQCPNANVRANLLRMLGNLVLILLKDKNLENQDLIKHISLFILDACATETQAWVIAESIDAIMDIYAEDETDRLAADIKLVSRLQSLIPHFKNKVRQQKKHFGDNVSIVSTVNANLTRFIKYKEKQVKHLK